MLKNIKNYVRDNEFKMILKNNIIDIINYTNIADINKSQIIIYVHINTI